MPRDLIPKFIKSILKLFFLLPTTAALYFPQAISAQEQGIQNFQKMKYGLFVHYVWGGTAYTATVNPDGSIPAGLDDLASRFDAGRFADDLASMKVEYVIFTAWHANMNCLWPSAKMNKWLPGHSSQRDVLRDMITVVKAKGIRVLLYTHPSDGHDLTAAEQAATGWGPTFDRAKWNDFINDLYGDLISRYGNDIEGVYIDENGGRNSNAKFVDYVRLRKTIKAGNTNLLMLQNDYGNIYTCDLGHKEVNWFSSTDGNTWPAPAAPSGVVVGTTWWASKPVGKFTPRYTSESIFRYTVLKAGIKSSAGGVAWAAGNYAGDGWEPGVLESMRRVAGYLQPVARSITNTHASTSFVTESGSTIQSLQWGVATESTDDRYEYIHVLTPPVGKTLHLPPPDDGKIFHSARLLANQHKVSLVQDKSGVSLTLDAGDAWAQLDTVIELTVRGKSASAVSASAADNIDRRPATTTLLATNGLTWTASGTQKIAPTPGMARWFDASTLRLTNRAIVTRWEDLSGNEAHAIRPAGDNTLPTYIADAGMGTGLGAIHFGPGSGLNPALDSQALSFRTDTKIRTVFSVFKGGSFLLTDYGAIHFHRASDTDTAAPLWVRDLTSPHVLGGKTYVNGQAVDGLTFFMPTNFHNGFNLVEVLATNTVTASGFNKDRYCHAGDQYQAEVLIYDFPLTEAQRLQTEAYLKTKWFGADPLPVETK